MDRPPLADKEESAAVMLDLQKRWALMPNWNRHGKEGLLEIRGG